MTRRIGRAARVGIISLAGVLVASACTAAPTPAAAPATAVVTPVAAQTSVTPTPSATPTATATPTAVPPLLAEGADGDQVRELQARLKQLKNFTSTVDGVYDAETTGAVQAFQTALKLPASGSVDETTWSTLLATTKAPSAEDLAGHLIAGPAILASGSSGAKVRELQARLKQLGRWTGEPSKKCTESAG